VARQNRVVRPTKSTEFEIVFGSRQAQVGWQNLLGTQRNALTQAWDQLSDNPLAHTPTLHPLKGELGVVSREGVSHTLRQYELSGGARIWFYVEQRQVILVDVHTRHPNQTK
jgi:hypothetical protein